MKVVKNTIIVFLVLLFTYSLTAKDYSTYKIQKLNQNNALESGDNQYGNAKQFLINPIKVIVTDENNKPITNIPVAFELLSQPKKKSGIIIHRPLVYTDSLGVAYTNITLGKNAGLYQVVAVINTTGKDNFQVFNINARKGTWVMMLIFGMLGGLALFLFGMHLTSEGMQKTAGDKMRSILSKLTNNRLIAVGVGTFVTIIVQSSSATTVMLISFVQSGLMTFAQTLGVILGADIGTTITTQLIAFKLTDYSLLLLGVGFLMYFFINNDKLRSIGETIFGFGILFFGMYIMSESMDPLKNYQPFIDAIIRLDNPMLGILIGTLFTAVIQSSAAFIGIVLILSIQGFISLESGIPLILGSNIGTAITAVLASIKTNIEAKKVAVAHTLFKVFGVLLFVAWIPYFADLVRWFSPEVSNVNDISDVLPRQLANAHTIFNVLMTICFLPFVNTFAKFINKLMPEKKKKKQIEEFETKYIDNGMLNTPVLALNLAKQETVRMGHVVDNMIKEIIIPFFEKNQKCIKSIEDKEREVNFLRDKIKEYLIQISKENIEKERVDEAFQIMFTIKELEQIADIISTILLSKAKIWLSSNYEFSNEGKEEIQEYHSLIIKQFERSIDVFQNVNLTGINKLKKKLKSYNERGLELEKKHYQRLVNNVQETITSSKTHLELLEMFKQINQHSTNIGKILLKWSSKKNKIEE